MKFPNNILRIVERYLPINIAAPTPRTSPDHDKEYIIDELSRESGVTVRNIRAYQDKGILPPPLIRGRTGIYSNKHLSRLHAIVNLLQRGYTANSIRELLDGIDQGVGIQELMGIESAVTSPWSNENPQTISLVKLANMFGGALTPEAIKKAVELQLFQIEGSNVRVASMSTIKAACELTKLGIPLMEMLTIISMTRKNVECVANEMVGLVANHVLKPYESNALPPKEELPRIAELIWRLRPLAEVAVKAELARAMEKSATQILADKLELILSAKPDEL
ncbi:MAG: MerR family transcriptional regulator [Flavobacteriales bacterium]|nr:MerR family transcriptional regulator [Flavobacteriales bacterium]